MASSRRMMTEAQTDLFETLDDMAAHVAWEFNPDCYQGISTIGFAHIHGIDGRSSFVQRAKQLANNDAVGWVTRDERVPASGRVSPVRIEIGQLDLSLAPSHDSGYRLSINNVSSIMPGPEHQRLDVRERLHNLVLSRLQYNGYIEDAYVKSRMD